MFAAITASLSLVEFSLDFWCELDREWRIDQSLLAHVYPLRRRVP
jgi:hypothetical protein